MARYFISTNDHVSVMDDEGIELANLEALRDLLRRTLTEILRDEGEHTGVNEFTAHAYDEHGVLIMKAQAGFFIVDQ